MKKCKLLKKSSNIFIENWLFRVKGRLEYSDLDFEPKFPLLLTDEHLAHLYILKSQVAVFHGGVENTLNHLRNRFWIIRRRQVVERILHRCVVCRRHQGKPLTPLTSPPLPCYRVSAELCFQCTGVDFAGPIFVKPIYLNDQRLHKAYLSPYMRYQSCNPSGTCSRFGRSSLYSGYKEIYCATWISRTDD